MPILDIELIQNSDDALSPSLAAHLADAAGVVFDAQPGSTWVRLRTLPPRQYAENGLEQPEGWRAVFVTVLQARRPAGASLQREAQALADAIANVCGRSPENVHILYEPEAAGRIAFGGRLKG